MTRIPKNFDAKIPDRTEFEITPTEDGLEINYELFIPEDIPNEPCWACEGRGSTIHSYTFNCMEEFRLEDFEDELSE